MPEVEMNNQHIEGMVRVLRSQIKDPDKAKTLLQNYWQDRVAIVWTVEQVHQAANEQELVLTNPEARQLLHKLHQNYDSCIGWNWFDLLTAIEESCLGRKINKLELHRFLNKSITAIAQ